ncbi:MAG: hypothetical protein ACOCRK_06550 [bacterium]
MPKDPTPRLKLKNPATGEFDWDKPWWENTKIIDDHPGIKVVTSETLPEEPWLGQVVFDTISLSLLIWEGNNWLNISSNYLFLQANSNISKGDLVVINNSGLIESITSFPSSIEDFSRIIGVAVQDITIENYGLIKTEGIIMLSKWNMEPGKNYYLNEELKLSKINPSYDPKILVGTSLNLDTLLLNLTYIN